jgi:hypothetical protein
VGIGLPSLVLLCFATPLGRHFPLSSPADNVLGWREFSVQIEDMRQRSGASWIATTDYGLTGELTFEIKGERHIQQIVDRQRFFFETPDTSLIEKPALLVVLASENRLERYRNCFQSSALLGILNRQAGERVIESYVVLKVEGAREDILSRGCNPT